MGVEVLEVAGDGRELGGYCVVVGPVRFRDGVWEGLLQATDAGEMYINGLVMVDDLLSHEPVESEYSVLLSAF